MRTSGILLPIFSLPSKYGIGCFSSEAREFVDFLEASGQHYWQILPLNPFGRGNSPYQPLSCFAGEPAYIDPVTLVNKGLLEEGDLFGLARLSQEHPGEVDYDSVLPLRRTLLRKAFDAFYTELPGSPEEAKFSNFCSTNESWLKDYSLYMALVETFDGKLWPEWERPLQFRDEALLEYWNSALSREIDYWRWTQYEFFSEWEDLREYAHAHNVEIIGDMPIYADYKSVDVWANPELFQLNEDLKSNRVSGAPPDAFAPEGQVWNNPLYDWDAHKDTKYAWWIARVKQNFNLFDVLRIDHTRGLESYFSIPAGEKTAQNGYWVPGPGLDLFDAFKESLGDCRFIAEDLGFLTPEVHAMIDATGYPGMKILQFAFDSDESNLYIPKNYTTDNSIVYTGTHDNNTTLGWYRESVDWKQRFVSWYLRENLAPEPPLAGEFAPCQAGEWDQPNFAALGQWPDGEIFDERTVLRGMIRLALSTRCHTCIIPMQDYLELGEEARNNIPGLASGNWKWQMAGDAMTKPLAARIRAWSAEFERV